MIETIHDLTRLLHICGGFLALLLFWVPVLSKKGGLTHKKIGLYWVWMARLVLVTALLGVIYFLFDTSTNGDIDTLGANHYAFYLFLAYLAIVAYFHTLYAVSVLRLKAQFAIVAGTSTKYMAIGSVSASLAIIAFALIYQPHLKMLLLLFSPIGLVSACRFYRYSNLQVIADKQWVIEHLTSMIEVGIAIHIAFAVFGGAQFFRIGLDSGIMTLLPWALPLLIGLVSIRLCSRYYRRKYGLNDA